MSTLVSDPVHTSLNPPDCPDWLVKRSSAFERWQLDLSPLRYAGAGSANGPIARIEHGRALYLGATWQLCRVSLKADLKPPLSPVSAVFSAADGSGVGKTMFEARAKAVSEALERWAYYETRSGPDAGRYGYPVADSTKGMAAFPGLFASSARSRAMAEAYEHYAVDSWWSGAFEHWAVEEDGFTLVFIRVPDYRGFVVLAIRRLHSGVFAAAYGTGSARTRTAAVLSAKLEALRMETALENADHPEKATGSEAALLRRASHRGFLAVRDRLNMPPWRAASAPRLLYDGPVNGPWQQFAHVWRYAFEPVCGNALGKFAA
ncbi:MAG: hypothetical protein JJT96_01360 [Opitutales bacterium]|nr:hypothetical protein [Opitutales bacterium]